MPSARTQLTVREAADHLGVSQLTLMKLLEREEIPCTVVGKQRRVLLDDLIAYDTDLTERRKAGLRAATQDAAEDGSYFFVPSDTQTR
ncbi:helix-turn-helix domain-containing protein [Kocuria marina]|uniref:helix-turn-helix domain-containing protein n=1 Tax=Kocuria marina TaxID=223184 RepID=UPI0022E981AE|nr:helix-turn-helix domain-containing protein [Kocuria marina]